MKNAKSVNSQESIPFRMHPRVFAALGADLITNDVVAIIELVKNSYDAFATNVWIRFGTDEMNQSFLEVEDDGFGMTEEIIRDVWSVVATPFKLMNPSVTEGTKKRRVTGEKGLGRLSTARLGQHLNMLTKPADEPCWEISVNWGDVSDSQSMDECDFSLQQANAPPFASETGTLIRITGLNAEWNESQINDLSENLARLVSPFADVGEFNIYTYDQSDEADTSVRIESPEFLSQPKYLLKGNFSVAGQLSCSYVFTPLKVGERREASPRLSWEQIYKVASEQERNSLVAEEAVCGPFEFEIRAWDIGAEDTQEISDNFGVNKSLVRKAIKAHKGISVYRDSILVLPKSESARDWLGLDLRRVSRVGTRVSTNQIVGHVSIGAEDNPLLGDTSDREQLASNREVSEFEAILKAAVHLLEIERDQDRVKPDRERPLQDLFEELSAEDLLAEVLAIAEEGAPATEAIPLLKAFNSSLEQVRETIQERFVFYSRMATVGSIAQMIIHEIRNQTTIIGYFLKRAKSLLAPLTGDLDDELRLGEEAIARLERLAENFAPLASRTFARRKRDSLLSERIDVCLYLQGKDIEKSRIRALASRSTDVRLAVDPGELDIILLNLISNAVYWLSSVDSKERLIEFKVSRISNGSRARVFVNDNGPGIEDEYVDKVLWPGVTRKPGGIGMGLTVSAELVSGYNGQLGIKHPGTSGGATFFFDLPIKK